MQKKMFKDTYPIYSLEFNKSDSKFVSVPEILDSLEATIEAHPKAVNIARFDHYTHTKKIDGTIISPDILEAQNIIFCFGWEIPSADPLAVRPRSIGVTDMGASFIVNFMEAPNPVAQEYMVGWVKALKK